MPSLSYWTRAPSEKGETRLEVVEDLLDSAEEFVHVDNVLMGREFDSRHALETIGQRGLSYVVPKRMQTSEKAQAKRLLQRDQDRYEADRKLHPDKNEWHETILIYRRKENSEHDDHRQYSVFMTNRGSGFLTEDGYRWEIESGYKSIKRLMTATTSKNSPQIRSSSWDTNWKWCPDPSVNRVKFGGSADIVHTSGAIAAVVSTSVPADSVLRDTVYRALGTSIFNWTGRRRAGMSLEMEHDCPECSNDTFWRTASTTLHLGEKTKWVCTDCDYGLVRIDGIDSSEHVGF